MSIHRQILALAWPAIATNITTPLLSLADVAITGHLEGGSLIGAVAVGGTVFNILYWIFAFLRMGTSGLTAQSFGAQDYAEQHLTLIRGALIALAGGFLLLILAPLAGQRLISLVDGNGSVSADAWLYFRIAICGAPGVLLSYVVSGWLLGMQRPKPIMWIALTTNVLNIALSVVFVYVLSMGIAGVALGTATAQIVGAAIGIFVVRNVLRKDVARVRVSRVPDGLFRKERWRSMFRLNSDIFLRTVCLAAVTLWFTHAGASLGKDILTANALLMQLFLVFSYFMDGFAFGGEALAGRYYGARDIARLRETVRKLFVWGISTSLLFTVLYFLCGDFFLELLTNDTAAISVARDFSLWAVTVPLMGFAAFTWDGILVGLTRSRYLLLSMAIAMFFFFGIYFGGSALLKGKAEGTDTMYLLNHTLWLAFIVYLFVRGFVATVLYRNFIRRLR